jgi:hypothetical protein
MEANSKRISLPDEEPEIFSSVLEYLYKGDYYPRLVHNKKKNTWELETGEGGTGSVESTVYHHGVDGELLKDTVIYVRSMSLSIWYILRGAELLMHVFGAMSLESNFSARKTALGSPNNPWKPVLTVQ